MKIFLNKLSKDISGVTISIFRIVLGGILLLQSIYWIITGFIQKNIIEPTFLFPFINELNPLNDLLMNYGLNGLLLFSSALIITSKYSRIGLVLYFFSFTYLWLLCQGYFNNHYYLISILCFILIFNKVPFSKFEKIRVPYLNLFILKYFIVIVYFIAGLNKINPYWLVDLQPMTYILSKIGINEHSIIIPFFSYTGLLFDLLIGPLLLIKKTRIIAIAFSIIFHMSNFIIFILAGGEIGFFPFIMIATLILFINPEKIEKKYFKKNARIASRQKYNSKVAVFLILFIMSQIVLPFRHYLFDGYVDYNGIGQRFSWRLKNMYKEPKTTGLIEFVVLSSKEDTVSTFNLYNVNKAKVILTDRQKTNLIYYPNMIPQFAMKIEKHFQKMIRNSNFNFMIKGECLVGFMGREPQLLFDKNIDLTNVDKSTYKTNTWLNKLERKPWDIK